MAFYMILFTNEPSKETKTFIENNEAQTYRKYKELYPAYRDEQTTKHIADSKHFFAISETSYIIWDDIAYDSFYNKICSNTLLRNEPVFIIQIPSRFQISHKDLGGIKWGACNYPELENWMKEWEEFEHELSKKLSKQGDPTKQNCS